ncbi:hypothetical protein AB0D49_21225 [Streptomyces sp. NPDC048290]|uniref:hypothetical protein n=1 Tax=Streptomyces sp. NPDC048290 TaxID=3155811 RepID=UPI00343E6FD8
MRFVRDTAVTAALFVLYTLVFVPLGLFARWVRDPLERRPSTRRASYWHPLDPARPVPAADRPRSAR